MSQRDTKVGHDDRAIPDVKFDSPIQPVYLQADDTFQFDCHPGISCFNACCRSIDIVLAPYDVLRLKNNLGVSTGEFIANYTDFYEVDAHGLPGLKLGTRQDGTTCVFLCGQGCSVYADRPTACRYYALGHLVMRKADSPRAETGYFVVKEPHCLGHFEPVKQTVCEYRHAQGLEIYDEMNLGFQELVLKKKSSGPTVGAPSARSMQLYFMAAYDIDRFAGFVQSRGFAEIFAITADELQRILVDEAERLRFAHRFLRQVLYGEMTIPLRENAREIRLEKKHQRMLRRQAGLHLEDQGKG